MTAAAPTAVPPTDMELMMLADGELDEERCAEIEAYLALPAEDDGAEAARGKLAGLRSVSALVAADGVWPERAGVDVVDGVFAFLDAETKDGLASRETPTIRERAASRDRASTPTAATGAAISRPTLEGSAASRRSGSAAPPRPANDNGRVIFGMALAAAAAAAGLFFWGKSGPSETEIHARTVATDVTPSVDPAPDPLPSPGIEGNGVEALRADPAEEEPRYGVEVASVDFGQRSGAIYYVPTDETAAAAAVTTVVWLADE